VALTFTKVETQYNKDPTRHILPRKITSGTTDQNYRLLGSQFLHEETCTIACIPFNENFAAVS
jgi:hypothetical protein